MYRTAVLLALSLAASPRADPPVASYLFPAGGQRGTTVKLRAGGLNLYERCPWELTGPGLVTSKHLTRIPTRWFEGPILPLPDSQRTEDYPQDVAGEVRIAGDAPLGPRRMRAWTSEGVSSGPIFVVGDLPETVEDEIEGDPVPVPVRPPLTVNGRIFPREDIDVWSVAARKGQVVTAEVSAARIGSPLDPRLEVRGPGGAVVAENDDHRGTDSLVSFVAPADGVYQIRIHDTNRGGSQRHVYRLTVTHDPHVSGVFPAGGRKGTRIRVQLTGPGVPSAPIEIALPDRTGPQQIPVRLGDGRTLSVPADVDDLPEVAGPGKTKVTVPAVCNGRIDRPGKTEEWTFSARKGQQVHVELRAARIGSALQGVIEVLGPDGKPTRRVEGGNEPDSSFAFAAPTDGDYTLRVSDRFRSRGGPGFAYRLRISDLPSPDFSLSAASDTLTLGRKKPARLRLTVRREGNLAGPVTLAAEGLPAGVKMTPDRIAAGQAAAELTFTASAGTPIGLARVRIRGSATVGGKTVTRTAAVAGGPPTEELLCAVGIEAPFKVIGTYDLRNAPRGTVFRKKFRIERNGYTGPLVVRLADRQARHLQGVTGPTLTVPPDVNSFDYPLSLPPWMEIGRTSRACVMAIGTVREGGADHVVSFTSQAQNDQIIAVVETGLLGLELGKTSLAVPRGGSAAVEVSVRRSKGLTGAVKVELVVPEHLRGVSARALTLPPDQSKGTLTVTFGKEAGRAVQGLTVRATLTTSGGPVTAEAGLELAGE